MDITKNEVVVLVEDKVFESPEATGFDKETKHVHRITYRPEVFKAAFADILENDQLSVTGKVEAICSRSPWWRDHIGKVLLKMEEA